MIWKWLDKSKLYSGCIKSACVIEIVTEAIWSIAISGECIGFRYAEYWNHQYGDKQDAINY